MIQNTLEDATARFRRRSFLVRHPKHVGLHCGGEQERKKKRISGCFPTFPETEPNNDKLEFSHAESNVFFNRLCVALFLLN